MSLYLEHMADHLRRGENPKFFSVRKEQHLYLYLWQQHIISSEFYEWLRSGNNDPYKMFQGLETERNIRSDTRTAVPRAGPSDRDNDPDDEDSDTDTIAAPSDQQSDFGDAEKDDKDTDEKDNVESKPFKKPRYFLPSKLEFARIKNSVIRGGHVQHKVAVYVDHVANELPMEWHTEMETEYELAT
jgi:hypothetical protein